MENNTQARKWALVINNPLEAGLDHAAIREILYRFSPTYFCMADEIATTGTYHPHIFVFSPSPMRFSTVKNRFATAHIEKAYGSAKTNRAYILKEGRLSLIHISPLRSWPPSPPSGCCWCKPCSHQSLGSASGRSRPPTGGCIPPPPGRCAPPPG